VGAAQISVLEQAIDAHEATLSALKNFILPGGSGKGAALHFARTVCRRAERGVVALRESTQVSPHVVAYLNRLSDLLFVLARAANAASGRTDTKW
jgi:cob(I)alamin adenosyltransferase